MQDGFRGRSAAPLVAVALALAYPAAVVIGPWALAGVVVLAAIAGCATAIARRPSAGLRLGLAATALWLVVGLAGAFAMQARAVGGFVWVLLVLYLLPLPLIPWLYAKTFKSSHGRKFGGSTNPRRSMREGAPGPEVKSSK